MSTTIQQFTDAKLIGGGNGWISGSVSKLQMLSQLSLIINSISGFLHYCFSMKLQHQFIQAESRNWLPFIHTFRINVKSHKASWKWLTVHRHHGNNASNIRRHTTRQLMYWAQQGWFTAGFDTPTLSLHTLRPRCPKNTCFQPLSQTRTVKRKQKCWRWY